MTTYHEGEPVDVEANTARHAKDVLAGLLDTPDAMRIGSVIELAETIGRARRQRDEALARIDAALATIRQHKASRAARGWHPADLALDIEADLAPRNDHPDGAA